MAFCCRHSILAFNILCFPIQKKKQVTPTIKGALISSHMLLTKYTEGEEIATMFVWVLLTSCRGGLENEAWVCETINSRGSSACRR